MNWNNRVDGLNLHDEFILNKCVDAIAHIRQLLSGVNQWNRSFQFNFQSCLYNFKT